MVQLSEVLYHVVQVCLQQSCVLPGNPILTAWQKSTSYPTVPHRICTCAPAHFHIEQFGLSHGLPCMYFMATLNRTYPTVPHGIGEMSCGLTCICMATLNSTCPALSPISSIRTFIEKRKLQSKDTFHILISCIASSGKFAKPLSMKGTATCTRLTSAFVDLCIYSSHAALQAAAPYRLARRSKKKCTEKNCTPITQATIELFVRNGGAVFLRALFWALPEQHETYAIL